MGKMESQIRLNVNIYKYVQNRRDNPDEMIARAAMAKSISLIATFMQLIHIIQARFQENPPQICSGPSTL